MRSLFITSCFLLSALAMFAQSDRGIITGTVTDTTGAVISNAQVEAKQVETGSLFPTTTTGTGNYTLTQLPVGTYEISVSAAGFKKFVRSGITVEVAQTLRIDIPLEVGATSESVMVSAEASLLKTESGDVSSNVNVSTLDTLPILSTGSAAAHIQPSVDAIQEVSVQTSNFAPEYGAVGAGCLVCGKPGSLVAGAFHGRYQCGHSADLVGTRV
jgi:hypothetical protein